ACRWEFVRNARSRISAADFIDAPLAIGALTSCDVAGISHHDLEQITRSFPNIARAPDRAAIRSCLRALDGRRPPRTSRDEIQTLKPWSRFIVHSCDAPATANGLWPLIGDGSPVRSGTDPGSAERCAICGPELCIAASCLLFSVSNFAQTQDE